MLRNVVDHLQEWRRTDTGTHRHFVGMTRGKVEYTNNTTDLGNKMCLK